MNRLTISKRLRSLRMSLPLSNAGRNAKWRALSSFHRIFTPKAAANRLNSELAGDGRHRIGFSMVTGNSLEHMRNLISAFDDSESCLSVLVGDRSMTTINDEVDDFLNRRHTIAANRVIFPYALAKDLSLNLLLEAGAGRYPIPKGCKRILYAHGMAGLNFSKYSESVRLIDHFDALFLNGPMHRRALELAAKQHGVALPDMYDIGYLRGDRLRAMSPSFDRHAFANRHNLDSAPIVTYAPTWGEFSSTKDWIETVVSACESLGVNLFLRLHPFMFQSQSRYRTGGIDWNAALRKLMAGTERVRISTGHSIDELLLASDLLITDVSGLGPEFLSLEKPVVFLPAEKFFNLFGRDRAEMWCRDRPEPTNAIELRAAIVDALAGQGSRVPVETLVYNKGRSPEAAMQAIESLLG